MKLTPAKRWINETFEAGVSVATVSAWVEKQIIPGVIIDGKAFVDADRAAVLLDTCTRIQAQTPQPTSTGNSTVASIMQGAMTR